MMWNRFVLAVVAIAALTASAHGARETALHHSDTGFTGRRITMTSASCPRVSGEITIDGRLDEAAWRSAGQVEPRLGIDANNNIRPNIVTDP
ncbi:MAG: hypothetical protein QF662_06270, partial [Phycisphaerae bacterium]|nr:hypothetical protein [Phycisphaerae bacterium]